MEHQFVALYMFVVAISSMAPAIILSLSPAPRCRYDSPDPETFLTKKEWTGLWFPHSYSIRCILFAAVATPGESNGLKIILQEKGCVTLH